MSEAEAAEKRGISRWRASPPTPPPASTRDHGHRPDPASRKALEKAGWKVDDLDLVEANEAFAAQACAVNKDMGWDPAIVNVNGGAIAIGHPIGASGARFSTRCCSRCSAATPRRASRRCASAAAWAWRSASNAPETEGGKSRRRNHFASRRLTPQINPGKPGQQVKTRRRRRHHGTSSIRDRRVARDRRSDFQGAEGGEGYTVAATYAGNDEKAAAFTETGIKTYKWNVADYEASKAGIAQVEADLGPSRSWSPMPASPATRCSTR
jgi:hypothetical protein